jgi:hypothetical protein
MVSPLGLQLKNGLQFFSWKHFFRSNSAIIGLMYKLSGLCLTPDPLWPMITVYFAGDYSRPPASLREVCVCWTKKRENYL